MVRLSTTKSQSSNLEKSEYLADFLVFKKRIFIEKNIKI